MNPVLVDTDILSMFLRNHPVVVQNFSSYLSAYESINITILSHYEIVSGLKYRNANKQLESYLGLSNYLQILPLSIHAVEKAAEIYATLRKKGLTIDDTRYPHCRNSFCRRIGTGDQQ